MGPSATDLRTIPLFHNFVDGELAAIGGLFTPVTVAAGKPLFELGEPATTLYVLTGGEVVLDRPGDDVFKLSPPALIGELGALTNLLRSTRDGVARLDGVAALSVKLQAYFADNQELGVRFLANLLSAVADKVHRDQERMGDMRQNLVRTQKELKRVRELVLEAAETPISAPVHDALDKLITHNRRVNYRVEPPGALAANLRLDDGGAAKVLDISRTHVTVRLASAPAVGTWLSGVLHLAGTDVAVSGKVHRTHGDRMTLELDLLIDESVAILEGYLTRAQLLDILC